MLATSNSDGEALGPQDPLPRSPYPPTCYSPIYYRRDTLHTLPRDSQHQQIRDSPDSENGMDSDRILFDPAACPRCLATPKHYPEFPVSRYHLQEDQVAYQPMPEDEKLGYISTGSLIISNVVGTGVFTKAPYILSNCGSKGVSLLLWVAGGLISFVGLFIYIELGIAFPFNGADLVYTDEAYPKPKLLAPTIVSMIAVLVKSFAGNALLFAQLILESFEPDKFPDPRLQKFFAWFMMTGVCLLHFFSRRIGVAINNVLAILKTFLMVFIVLVGFSAMGGARGKNVHVGSPKYGLENFKNAMKIERKSMSEYSYAILGVLWAYLGWENANYVLAEIKRPPRDESKVFKRASLTSYGILTVLYVLCNVSYYVVLADEELGEDGEMVAIKFFWKVFGDGWFHKHGLKLTFALSILGNYIANVYAIARLKQEIAKLKILPFSKFWARQSHYGTPSGGLILHWLFASLMIIITPNNGGNNDAYNLITNVYTYCQSYIFIIVGLTFVSLKYHPKFRNVWSPKFLSWPAIVFVAPTLAAANLFIIVLTWFPTPNPGTISSVATPAAATGCLLFGAIYWLCYSKLLPILGYHVDHSSDVTFVDGRRIVTFHTHKTGLAKKLSDWLSKYFGGLKRNGAVRS